jgi:hypothetical protein
MFMSPSRSELNAICRPSGAHDARLSTRVVATSVCGTPVARPVTGSTGRRPDVGVDAHHREREVPAVGRHADLAIVAGAVVTCCGAPSGAPSFVIGTRQMLSPPPRDDEK